jgi:hypothetical protein
MSLSTEISLVWTSVSSALKDFLVVSSTSSVTGFSVELFLVAMSSGMGSSTSTESHVSANNLCTIVVIPEVVRGQWSPFSISCLSPNVTG